MPWEVRRHLCWCLWSEPCHQHMPFMILTDQGFMLQHQLMTPYRTPHITMENLLSIILAVHTRQERAFSCHWRSLFSVLDTEESWQAREQLVISFATSVRATVMSVWWIVQNLWRYAFQTPTKTRISQSLNHMRNLANQTVNSRTGHCKTLIQYIWNNLHPDSPSSCPCCLDFGSLSPTAYENVFVFFK